MHRIACKGYRIANKAAGFLEGKEQPKLPGVVAERKEQAKEPKPVYRDDYRETQEEKLRRIEEGTKQIGETELMRRKQHLLSKLGQTDE